MTALFLYTAWRCEALRRGQDRHFLSRPRGRWSIVSLRRDSDATKNVGQNMYEVCWDREEDRVGRCFVTGLDVTKQIGNVWLAARQVSANNLRC